MDDFLLDLLVCPKSGGKLVYDKNANELICRESKLAYPIKDGIPIMLIESARKLKETE
tara:strand:- start:356 stop:529 length:174 start_codon:yes stop_codon:yes gene_type:complete